MARLCLLAVMLLGSLLMTSCMLVDEDRVQKDDEDRIPWNERQDWEGKTIGIPQ